MISSYAIVREHEDSAGFSPREALQSWLDADLRIGAEDVPRPVADGGNVNRTFVVGGPPSAILQWVNPIFDAKIHLDIDKVTRHLRDGGLEAPRLLPTIEGKLWIDDPARGYWRLMTYVPGRTFHRLRDPAQAASAGAFVGRFHDALANGVGTLEARPRHIHDTAAHMQALEHALEECDGHPLAGETRELGVGILDAWQSFEAELDLPERMCHGDLKISNLRFDESGTRALALIDLDTLEPMPYACELGDAWRSWCNPAAEDEPEASRFELAFFTAAAGAWLAHAPPLEECERRSLVPGIERIALELSARFAADAVRNVYFREDRERHDLPGAHNLLKARGQFALAHSARRQRADCEAVIEAQISRNERANSRKR